MIRGEVIMMCSVFNSDAATSRYFIPKNLSLYRI